jgi:hypothetical protein
LGTKTKAFIIWRKFQNLSMMRYDTTLVEYETIM